MAKEISFFSSLDVEQKTVEQVDKEIHLSLLPQFSGKDLIESQSEARLADQDFINSLFESLKKEYDDKKDALEDKGVSKVVYFAFGFTCLAGFICAFLDGIDGIVSIVQLLPLPSVLSALIIASFVLISITVFIGFDVTESAKPLGIELDKSASSSFGKISDQKQKLQEMNLYLEQAIVNAENQESLEELAVEIKHLISINKELDKEIKAVEEHMNTSPAIFLWRKFAAVSCMLLYLNFGFFTGQAGILYLLGNITMAVAMTQPLIAATVIGVALLSAFGYAAFYWMVQRSGVENLVTKQVYGVDLEALENIQTDEYQSQLSTSLDCKQKSIEQKQQYLKLSFQEGSDSFIDNLGLLAHDSAENSENIELNSQIFNEQPLGQAL